jgi:hypothetical protein
MLHVATVATHPKYYFPYLEKTCSKWNVKLTVLGMGEKWGGYVWKFKKILEFLRSVPGDDVVCFVDGYDVVATKDLNELVPKFLEIRNRENCDMIVAKDSFLAFPFDRILHIYFGSCNGVRINSGTYIGYASDLLQILSDAVIRNPDEQDDQRLLTQYCSLFPKKFYIDMRNELFQVCPAPLQEMKLNKHRPFFAHAPGCAYLTNVVTDMGYTVDPKIKEELRAYFLKKVYEHTVVFFKRHFLIIVAFILILILVIRILKGRSTR